MVTRDFLFGFGMAVSIGREKVTPPTRIRDRSTRTEPDCLDAEAQRAKIDELAVIEVPNLVEGIVAGSEDAGIFAYAGGSKWPGQAHHA